MRRGWGKYGKWPFFISALILPLLKSTSIDEVQIDLKEVNKKLTSINKIIKENTDKHNVLHIWSY
jgi:hypothetical protein